MAVGATGPAVGQTAGISIQLNSTRQLAETCRVSFVLRNSLAQAIADLTFEIVLFDAAGSVGDFLVLDAGSLPAGKTRVMQYDLAGQKCGQLSELLINDVKSCRGDGLDPAKCLELLRPSSAVALKLVM